MSSVSKWILTGATVLLMQGVGARENWGPPQPCSPPPANCCPKQKCCPKPCKPRCAKPCKPACPQPECVKPCKPPCPQPCPPTQICPEACPDPCCPPWPVPVLNAAYNYPAGIKTRCPWNIFFDASFIYWQPLEDNLELGFINRNTAPFTTPFTPASPLNATSIKMDFDYKPGFKLSAGTKFDYDNWDVHAEYTWFHGTQHKRASVPVTTPTSAQIFGIQGLPFSGEFNVLVGSGIVANVFDSARAEWNLKMDLVDLDLGRWYYVGTKLTFRPAMGVRGAFIRQNYDVSYVNNTGFGLGFVDVQHVVKSSKSWAVGPEASLATNWMMGAGFRFFGNGEADILYTRYTKVTFKEDHSTAPVFTAALSVPDSSKVRDSSVSALRAHMDLEMGLGWGMYFNCNKWYVDLSAGYEFQIYWDQNMFRKFTDDISWFTSIEPNGNLYIHGLTATVRVDF